jgi:hypothetical protein
MPGQLYEQTQVLVGHSLEDSEALAECPPAVFPENTAVYSKVALHCSHYHSVAWRAKIAGT